MLSERKKNYYELNTKLSYLSNDELNKILSTAQVTPKGLGSLMVIELDGHQIFCKQVKMTYLEYVNQFDTSNLFGLPTYYNYPIGSEGINCNRELLMHIKTTNWVLNGEIENFPLMYHYRIIIDPMIKNPKPKKDAEYFNKKINYWNSVEVGTYLEEKVESSYSILYFMEYIPLTAEKWLDCDYHKNILYLEQVFTITKFLNDRGIIHFDMHPGNVLINEQTLEFYLTDFGLVYDPDFLASGEECPSFWTEEQNFYHKNIYYDYIDILSNGLLNGIKNLLISNPQKINNIDFDKNWPTFNKIKFIYQHLDEIAEKFNVSMDHINLIKKHEPNIMIHEQFIHDLKQNPKKDDTQIYPLEEIENGIKNF